MRQQPWGVGLAIVGGLLILSGGLGYELYLALDLNPLFCPMCPTVYHPRIPSVLVGAAFGSAIVAIAVALGNNPAFARTGGFTIIGLSVIGISLGDQFLVGGLLGVLGGILVMRAGMRPART